MILINSGDNFSAPSFSQYQNNLFIEENYTLKNPNWFDLIDFMILICACFVFLAFSASEL